MFLREVCLKVLRAKQIENNSDIRGFTNYGFVVNLYCLRKECAGLMVKLHEIRAAASYFWPSGEFQVN